MNWNPFRARAVEAAVDAQTFRDIEEFNALRQQVSDRDEIIKALMAERNDLAIELLIIKRQRKEGGKVGYQSVARGPGGRFVRKPVLSVVENVA